MLTKNELININKFAQDKLDYEFLQNWYDGLSDERQKAVINDIWYYLSVEAIDKTLAELSSLCTGGSALVFDYPDENFFGATEKRVQNTIRMAKAGGEPMKTAFSHGALEKLLEKHGFLICELLTPDDIQREIIEKAGADMKAFEHVNYCIAVRKN